MIRKTKMGVQTPAITSPVPSTRSVSPIIRSNPAANIALGKRTTSATVTPSAARTLRRATAPRASASPI